MSAPYPELNGREPCREGDAGRFFPEGKGRKYAQRYIEPVLAECHTCHVEDQCLAYALTHDVVGIWGGTTDERREELRRQHNIKAVRTDAYRADVDMIIRGYQRHLPSVEIAKLAGVAEGTVQRILREYRNGQVSV